MRKRLARAGSVDYQVERSNETWADHQARTLVTGALISWLRPDSVLDPACGDGSIVLAADRLRAIRRVTFNDVSIPNISRLVDTHKQAGWEYHAIDVTTAIDGAAYSDVVVLTEILEHLEDPDAILRAAKMKGRYLVASSPEMRAGQIDGNPEHLWQFDRDGYRQMLADAGWEVAQYTYLHFKSEYDFGVWVCR